MKLALAELDKLPKFPNLKEKSFDNYTLLDTWLTNVDLVCNSGHLPEKIICNRIRLLNSGPHNMMMTKWFSTVPPGNWLYWNPYNNGKGDIIPGLRALITNQFMPPESKTHAMAKFYKICWDSYPSPQEFLTNFEVNANLCPDPPSKEARRLILLAAIPLKLRERIEINVDNLYSYDALKRAILRLTTLATYGNQSSSSSKGRDNNLATIAINLPLLLIKHPPHPPLLRLTFPQLLPPFLQTKTTKITKTTSNPTKTNLEAPLLLTSPFLRVRKRKCETATASVSWATTVSGYTTMTNVESTMILAPQNSVRNGFRNKPNRLSPLLPHLVAVRMQTPLPLEWHLPTLPLLNFPPLLRNLSPS